MFVSGLLSFLPNMPSSAFKNPFFTEVLLRWHNMLLGFLAKLCQIMEVAFALCPRGRCWAPPESILDDQVIGCQVGRGSEYTDGEN